MNRKLITIIASFLLGGCSHACELVAPAIPVVLFAEAKSFQPISQAMASFSKLGEFRELEGDIDNVKCVEQPVNRLEYNYAMDGMPGRLELVFYFGRLAETRFHPDDPAKFFADAAQRELPSTPDQEKEIGNKVLWATGRSYSAETLGASDRRLSEQFEDWIRQRD